MRPAHRYTLFSLTVRRNKLMRVAPLVSIHVHREFHGVGRLVDVERIDEHGFRQFTRGTREGAQDQHAILVVA